MTPAQQTALPLDVDELTPEWLTSALRERFPGVVVEAVETAHVNWGTATKVFLRLTYREGTAPADLPARVCVKGGFDQRLRQMGVVPHYVLEAQFFRDMAPRLTTPLPRALYADAEPDRQGVVILEDLNDREVTFGTPTEPWGADRIATALEVLALQHGQTWNSEKHRFPWLTRGGQAARGTIRYLHTGEVYRQLIARDEIGDLPGAYGDGDRLLEGYEKLWQFDETLPPVLNHGDPHLGQLFIEQDGSFAFLDWQTVALSPWSHDVAYFLVGAMEIEERRAAERDLLKHYLGAFAAAGGPELAFDEAWTAYRRHCLHGIVWNVTPTEMQESAVVAAMSARYTAAAVDHDPLSLLGLA